MVFELLNYLLSGKSFKFMRLNGYEDNFVNKLKEMNF